MKPVPTALAAAALSAALALAPLAAADTTLIVGGTKADPTLAKLIGAVRGDATGGAVTPVFPPGSEVVDYPASIWPTSGLFEPFLGPSVAVGYTNTLAAIDRHTGEITVISFSQGGLVVHRVQNHLAANPDEHPGAITFVYFGDPEHPHNGLFSVLPVPFEGFVPERPQPSQYDTIYVANQYDPAADFPDKPWNLVAVANVLFGFALGTHDYETTDLDDLPADTVTTHEGNVTNYFIPNHQLPLTLPLRMAGVPAPIVDAIDGVVKPIIEAGYAPSPTRGTAVQSPPVNTPVLPHEQPETVTLDVQEEKPSDPTDRPTGRKRIADQIRTSLKAEPGVRQQTRRAGAREAIRGLFGLNDKHVAGKPLQDVPSLSSPSPRTQSPRVLSAPSDPGRSLHLPS